MSNVAMRIRNTRQLRAIHDVLNGTDRPVSIEEIHRAAKAREPGLGVRPGADTSVGPPSTVVKPLLVLERRAGQLRDRAERRLRGVQPEAKILIVIGGVNVGRLMPLGIPAVADLRAALVLPRAD